MDNLNSRLHSHFNSLQQPVQQQTAQYQHIGHQYPYGMASMQSSQLTMPGSRLASSVGGQEPSSNSQPGSLRSEAEMERLRLRVMLLERQVQNQPSANPLVSMSGASTASAFSTSASSPQMQYVPNSGVMVDEYMASLVRSQLNTSLKASEERVKQLDALLKYAYILCI